MHYDQQGRLARAGDTSFDYDARAALRERRDRRGAFRFRYGKGGLLEAVTLPSGEELRYEYDKSNPVGPARRYRCNNLTAKYVWLDPLRLAAFLVHDHQLEYTFTFSKAGLPDRVRIAPMSVARSAAHKPGRGTPLTMEQTMDWLSGMGATNRRTRLQPLFGNADKPLELLCGRDQAGTLTTLTDARGRTVKEVRYDSFGNVLHDTNPDLRLPLGFAGGLVDHATGLVRFGFRDYDPSVGRFTAPDPANDRRGDGDLYDYCADDPVSRRDMSGLDFEDAVREGENQLARGVGLGTRGLMDSFLGLGDAVAAPARWLMNKGNEALGGSPDYFKPMTGTVPDALGLPEARTDLERFAYNVMWLLL